MKIKTGAFLRKVAYGFYTLGVFFLIAGMLLVNVVQPVNAEPEQTQEVTETVPDLNPPDPEWDRSSLSFDDSFGCQGDCQLAQAKVCNGADSRAMAGTSTYHVYFTAPGGTQEEKTSGTINALGPGECQVLTYNPNNVEGEYIFRFDQRPGHPGNGDPSKDVGRWSKPCNITGCSVPQPKDTYLTIVKTVVGNPEADPDSFSLFYKVSGGTDQSATNGVTMKVSPGTYSVWEGAHDGYTQTYGATCQGGTISLAEGDNKTCEVINTYNPPAANGILIVKKIVVDPRTGQEVTVLQPGDVTIYIKNGDTPINSFAGSTEGTSTTVLPGTYSVSEAAANSDLATLFAQYTASYSGDCNGSGDVTVPSAGTKTCVITNTWNGSDTPDPAHLTVYKNVVGGSKQPENFNISVTGGDWSGASFLGTSAGYRIEIPAGITFSVGETTDPDYTMTSEGDCADIVTEANGEYSCTITNTYNKASLTVIKQVINDNGGKKVAADFQMHVSNDQKVVASFPGVSGKGYTLTMVPGPYSVTETNLPGYKASVGNNCTGELGAGQSVTCVIVNDDIPPVTPPGNAKLTVIKEVVGGSKKVNDFPLFVNTDSVTSGQTKVLLPGSYVVSETGDPEYTGAFSGDCDANGVVVLKDGNDKTCKITNTYNVVPTQVVTPHGEDPQQEQTPVPTLPAPRTTPAAGSPLIPVTGADLSTPGLPLTALPRLAINLGIALFGIGMVIHGTSKRYKDED